MKAGEVEPGVRYWLRSTSEPFEAYRVWGDRVDGFMKSGLRRRVDVSDLVAPLGRVRCVTGCGVFDADRLKCPSCQRPVDPKLRSVWPGG